MLIFEISQISTPFAFWWNFYMVNYNRAFKNSTMYDNFKIFYIKIPWIPKEIGPKGAAVGQGKGTLVALNAMRSFIFLWPSRKWHSAWAETQRPKRSHQTMRARKSQCQWTWGCWRWSRNVDDLQSLLALKKLKEGPNYGKKGLMR